MDEDGSGTIGKSELAMILRDPSLMGGNSRQGSLAPAFGCLASTFYSNGGERSFLLLKSIDTIED